jgi:hypothetical protein
LTDPAIDYVNSVFLLSTYDEVKSLIGLITAKGNF